MTTTTVLHATVAREILRIRDHLGYRDFIDDYPLEAHELARALTHAVSEILEHAHQLTLTESPN